jgi:hypothetical protein
METPRSEIIPVRVESAPRTTLSNHRAWVAALTVTLALLLPGPTASSPTSSVADGELSSAVHASQPEPKPESAKAKSKAAAKAAAKAAKAMMRTGSFIGMEREGLKEP